MINNKISKTVLVSGASGLLGNELVNQLLNDSNYKVIALTSQVDKLAKQYNHENLLVLHIDDWIDTIDSNVEIDAFINCAFPRSSKPDQLAKGLVFTENIIKDTVSLGVKSIINISSQSVYSQKEKTVTDESLTVAPESLYGMAKYASERIVHTICETKNEKIYYTNIRLASLTGRDFDVRMTNRFVKSALTNQPITINGGGQSISYLEVRDAAAALISMIDVEASEWKTEYNLGNNESFTLLELTDIIQETAKQQSISDVEVIVNEGQANFSNLLTSDLFYKDFNWQPEYNITFIVRELFYYELGEIL